MTGSSSRSAEKNGFGRAVQKPRYAALARGVDDDFRAAAVDGMKIAFVRHPHAGQGGKVIDILDIVERFPHQRGIEYRTLNIMHARAQRMREREYRECVRGGLVREAQRPDAAL